MCRNIKTLFNFDPPVTDDEVRAASLQFVRKITGFNKPSKANEDAFLAAIDEIAGISNRLLRSLETTAPPKNCVESARIRGPFGWRSNEVTVSPRSTMATSNRITSRAGATESAAMHSSSQVGPSVVHRIGARWEHGLGG